MAENCRSHLSYHITRIMYTVLNVAVFQFWTKKTPIHFDSKNNNVRFLLLNNFNSHFQILISHLLGIIHLVSAQIFLETNTSYTLIRTRTCAYQGLRNISFSENFAHVLSEWPFISSFQKLTNFLNTHFVIRIFT